MSAMMRIPTGIRISMAAALLVPGIGACGGDGEGGFSGPPQVGEEAPAFAAPSLSTGDTVSLESLRGRPVVVNLWATWCAPCRHETPYLQSVYERYKDDGLVMVGISVDGRSAADDARAFLEEMGVTYIQLHDPSMRSMDVFRVLGLPATYVIDADGRLHFAENRPVSEGDERFESAIEAAVEARPEPGAGEPLGGAFEPATALPGGGSVHGPLPSALEPRP